MTDDDQRRGPHPTDRSANLRLALFSVGIALDDDEPRIRATSRATEAPEPDRAKIRRILAAKVPPHHLDWMAESCPSIKEARAYRHPEPSRGAAPIPPLPQIAPNPSEDSDITADEASFAAQEGPIDGDEEHL